MFVNIPIFTFGQVWILGVETYILIKYTGLPFGKSFKEIFIINFLSTVLVGFLFPVILAAISLFFSWVLNSNMPAVLGTWAIPGGKDYSNLLFSSIIVWFVISFFLTVKLEGYCLIGRWKRSGLSDIEKIPKIIWVANTISYLGLVVIGALALVLSNVII